MTTPQHTTQSKGPSESEQAGTLVFGQVLSMIAQAILPWIIIRLVAKVDVGAFSSLMLLYSTSAIVLSSGFSPTLLYFNSDRSRSERGAVTRRIFLILTVLGGITGLLLYTLALSADVLVPPQNSRLIAERIPNARLIEYEGAGHDFLDEAGAEAQEDILRFLVEVDAARPTASPS